MGQSWSTPAFPAWLMAVWGPEVESGGSQGLWGRPQEGGSSPWLPPVRAAQALPKDFWCLVRTQVSWTSALHIQVPPVTSIWMSPCPVTRAGSIHVFLDFVLIYPASPSPAGPGSPLSCEMRNSLHFCLLHGTPLPRTVSSLSLYCISSEWWVWLTEALSKH